MGPCSRSSPVRFNWFWSSTEPRFFEDAVPKYATVTNEPLWRGNQSKPRDFPLQPQPMVATGAAGDPHSSLKKVAGPSGSLLRRNRASAPRPPRFTLRARAPTTPWAQATSPRHAPTASAQLVPSTLKVPASPSATGSTASNTPTRSSLPASETRVSPCSARSAIASRASA